jgi:hypothetical protein
MLRNEETIHSNDSENTKVHEDKETSEELSVSCHAAYRFPRGTLREQGDSSLPR